MPTERRPSASRPRSSSRRSRQRQPVSHGVRSCDDARTQDLTPIVHPKSAVLTVENTGGKLSPQVAATLAEPFLRGTKRIRTDHAGATTRRATNRRRFLNEPSRGPAKRLELSVHELRR